MLSNNMSTTNIQWTDVTDNIFHVKGGGWWCRMISPGCAHCYAAKINQNSFYGGNKLPYSGAAPEMVLDAELCRSWERMTKPKKHFVASMTDIFGEWVHEENVFYFLDAMHRAPRQTFQLLTKRAEVMKGHILKWLDSRDLAEVPSHMWLGVSVEDQQRADERIPILMSIPAVVRFLSVEPLLGPVDLWDARYANPGGGLTGAVTSWGHGISWVIIGGESGTNARPCNVDWILPIVKECKAADVACFVKQLGQNAVYTAANLELHPSAITDPRHFIKLHGSKHHPNPLKDKKGGEMSEWPADLQVRQFPTI